MKEVLKEKKREILLLNASHLFVSVNNISWMEVFNGFEELVHHITFMDVLQEGAFLYHSMQVRI